MEIGYDLRQKLSYTPANNQGGSYQKGSGYGNYRGNSTYQGGNSTYQGGGGFGNQRGGGFGNQKYNKNEGFQNQSNRFQALSDQSGFNSQGAQQKGEYTTEQIMQSMGQDMDEWMKSKMWPFSSFTFLKDMPSFPGFDDLSPEEVRLKAYEAEITGAGQTYRNWYNQLLNEYTDKRVQIMKPSVPMKSKLVDAIESIQRAAKASQSTSSSTNNQGLFGSTGGTFGSSALSAPTGLFGNVSSGQPTASGSVFGGGNQAADQPKGLFGKASTNPSTAGGSVFGSNTPSSVFGAVNQSVDQSRGLFGNSVTNSNSGIKPLMGVATPQTQNQTGGLFGNQTSSATTSGGMFVGGQTGNQAGGVFGNPAPTQSIFGGSTPMGSQTASTAMPGGFGNSASTPGAVTGLFGNTATGPVQVTKAQDSIFGQAPVGNPLQPSAFPSQQGNPSQNQDSGAQKGTIQKSGLYTDLASLTAEEKTAFEAPKFVLGKIPTRPPPRELV